MKMEIIKVDSQILQNWVNDITVVHNQIVKGELFTAGFNLCFLQQYMIDVLKCLESQEKTDH